MPNSAVTKANVVQGNASPNAITVREEKSQPLQPSVGQDRKGEFFANLTGALNRGAADERRRDFVNALANMTAGDALETHRALREASMRGDPADWRAEWEAFWVRWGEVDGATAAQQLYRLGEKGKWGTFALDLRRVLRGWGRTSPSDAAKWLEGHQDDEFFPHLAVGFTEGYASRDLRGATKTAMQTFGSGDSRLSPVIDTLAEQAMRQGRENGLVQWFDELPYDAAKGNAKTLAMEGVTARLERVSLQKAMDWVSQQAQMPWRSDRAILDVAKNVGVRDPAVALSWVEKMPPSPASGIVIGLPSAIRILAGKDEAAVQKWLGEPHSPEVQKQATAAFQEYLAKKGQSTGSE